MGIPNETRIVGDAHSKDLDWIMKLSTFLLPFALGASPPPMSKTCPDCVGFDNAAQNLIQLNNKIIQTWLNLINAQCSGLPGNEQAICSLVADVGFTNWMNVILATEPKEYCTDLTMCEKTPLPLFGQSRDVVQHCGPCKEFMNDLFLIAKMDKDHFHQFYTQVASDMCQGLKQQKFCFKELSDPRNEEKIRAFMADQEPATACEVLYFC